MFNYRAYFFDERDHARHAIDIVCVGDRQAVDEAGRWDHDYAAIELWQGDRLVRRLQRALAA